MAITSPVQSAKNYRVVFIGKNGRELAASLDNPAQYQDAVAGEAGVRREVIFEFAARG